MRRWKVTEKEAQHLGGYFDLRKEEDYKIKGRRFDGLPYPHKDTLICQAEVRA